MALGHITNEHLNRSAYRFVNEAILCGLTNANVAAADTVAGLKAAIAALQATNKPNEQNLLRHAQSAIQAAADSGLIADADILGLTTTAGLQGLFTTNDSTLLVGDTRSFAYSPRTGSV